MSAFEAIVLGIVQGLTEFLPVSSTAHLRIVPAFAGWEDPGAAFTAVTQLGTMAGGAPVLPPRPVADRARLAGGRCATPRRARDLDARLGLYIVLGTIPIGVFGLVFSRPDRERRAQPDADRLHADRARPAAARGREDGQPRARHRVLHPPRRHHHRLRAGGRARPGRLALGRDADRRPVPGPRAAGGGALLVPAVGAGGRALGAVRAAQRRRRASTPPRCRPRSRRSRRSSSATPRSRSCCASSATTRRCCSWCIASCSACSSWP